jgi:hypothetical protein
MTTSKRFLLRLDPDLFEALRRWADDELRSINGQIEYLLTDQARRAGRLPPKRARPSSDDDSSGPSGEGPESEERARSPQTRSVRSRTRA